MKKYNNIQKYEFLNILLMKKIKSFLKKIDSFGVPYSFRYKTKKNYTTSLGGIVLILFFVLVFSFVIYYFIPFAGMKNFSNIYYITNLPKPEPINLNSSKSPFSLGLFCENNNININNVFEFETKFISVKNINGNYLKTITNLTLHDCNLNDFYNNYNEDFKKLNLINHKCLDNNDFIIEGIYLDEIFSYYEFNLKSKLNSEENINNINMLLINNECKLHFVYTDINIDLNNYKNPIESFLNSLYIELYPNALTVQHIYLANQYLFNDNKIFGVFNGDDSGAEKNIFFSRLEGWVLEQDNSKNFAKIFLKSDNKKIYIKRKYQKFIEFYADISSIFISIYCLLMIIINYFNNFLAEFSLSKKIFLFKDINYKNIDFKKKFLKIHQLISLTNQNLTKIGENDSEEEVDDKKNKNIDLDIDDLEISRIKNEILNKVFNSENQSNNKDYSDKELKLKKNNKGNLYKKSNLNNNKNMSFNSKSKINPQEINKSLFLKKGIKAHDISYSPVYYHIYNNKEQNNNSSDRSSETRREIYSSSRKKKRINYNFNLWEIIIVSIFKCCMSENLKVKNDLNLKANKILYNKLDIVVYIRNMLILDIINHIILDSDRKYIANFLSRPIISDKEMNENEFQEYYKEYEETEFIKTTLGINKLLRIKNQKKSEQKLIALCNKQLKNIL